MHLSDLQQYILYQAFIAEGKKFSREKLVLFYEAHHQKTKTEQRVKAITRSIERLIDRELLIGYGVRTPHKWFISDIKATSKGMTAMKRILSEQQKLPFKRRKQ